MKGMITSYRRGRKTQRTNHMLIKVEGVSTTDEAKKLVGKKVEWTTPGGKKMVGKIYHLHGSSGVVRARFPKGLPGQAIGTEIKVL